jgi:outer membrane protein OmpA-like peptidoglycan-associated protein
MTARRGWILGLTVAGVILQGCPSTYQRTYDEKTQQLEARDRANQQLEAQAHAQAQKYAAVVYFAVGKADLDADAQGQLRWFVQQMQPYPQAMFDVQGFADSTGSEATNAGLSQQRAEAVANYLASQGIAPSRMVTKGFGTASPAASNVSAQGRRNNRRVEVTVR